jgi:transcription-repair coupling factor (superfamily II helicase)
MDVDVDYYIPDSFIPDPGTKMRIYRRMLLASEQEEVEAIRSEIEDRFGKLPMPVENFLQVASMRLKARDKQIRSIRHKGKDVEIHLSHPLPGNFVAPNGLKYKKLGSDSLVITIDKSASLQSLQQLLDWL